ncbi:hypothetical protein HDR66_02595, partial [bacterium]|nr:hypothetical protein [bacterium]
MKRIVIFIAVLVGGIGFANAAVRSASNTTQSSRGTTTVTSRGGNTTNTSTSRATTSRTHAAQTSTTSRTASTAQTTRGTTSRTNAGNTTTRTATRQNTSRSASRTRAATTPTTAGTSRSATKSGATSRLSRAALITATAAGSNTFGSGYNACRDAYFTCMDQFCANMDDTYRRCICSSRLTEIRERERTLSDTSNQLQDFKDLNLDVITKTGAEVKAMLSATAGESAIKKDTSQSAKTLANISDVLSTTKSKALSTQGSLDIAGDINAIWATTDLASGTNLSNLEGETLYNAVHSQCVDLISNNCPGAATLNMVVSAYGMYIENDCTALSTALDKKYTTAKTAVRETQSAMHDARLENYDAHNSASINECIAQVRKDITADTACGTDYVHCMDITGKYLNRETGAALYTPQFFEIEKSVSLDGNVLTNTTNRMLVAELNNKKIFANRALNTCTDLADEVWDEFMRQAITEIYQGQRERVRQVKDECLAVVNQCYDTTSSQLRDF